MVIIPSPRTTDHTCSRTGSYPSGMILDGASEHISAFQPPWGYKARTSRMASKISTFIYLVCWRALAPPPELDGMNSRLIRIWHDKMPSVPTHGATCPDRVLLVVQPFPFRLSNLLCLLCSVLLVRRTTRTKNCSKTCRNWPR